MKRGELKALIKECVVEVLQEGIGGAPSRSRPASKMRSTNSRPNHPSDNISYGALQESRNPAPISVNTGLSQDPVLQSIFQDTASTTLQEQVSSERRGRQPVPDGADRAARFMADHEPDELFDGASNWEKLAFPT